MWATKLLQKMPTIQVILISIGWVKDTVFGLINEPTTENSLCKLKTLAAILEIKPSHVKL